MLYRAFGEQRYSSGTTPTDYQFTGQLAPDVELYYYGARWYDPALGRFTQADTLIPQPGNPLDWDRYAYVRNDPINGSDPSGHTPWYIGGWDKKYLYTQQGNTCAVVATAVSLSILTGYTYTQADIQPVFFQTYNTYHTLPVDTTTHYITTPWNPNAQWTSVNTALGVPPIEQATGINTMFPGQIQATYSQGTYSNLMNNRINGCPTMITIALPGSDVGHVLVAIGFDPSTNQLSFYNPAYGEIWDESKVLDHYNMGRGFQTFEELWAASNFWIPSNSMVTLSIMPPTPIISLPQSGGLGIRTNIY